MALRWVEYEGRNIPCIVSLNGTEHAWFDTFGDTLCAQCGCFVWDEEAKEMCKAFVAE